MHNYVAPASVKKRVVNRMGKLLANDIIEAGRTGLLVVDMQNYYCAPGFPLEVPMSREIVPNINRIARAVRAAGGVVVWIQMTAVGVLEGWTNFHTRMLAPDRQKNRLAGLDETSDSFNLFPTLGAR
jgi:ureidoacrylate peracid hydrolase